MSPVLLLFIITGFQLVGTLVSMSLGAYFMPAVAVPVAIVAYFFQRYYRKSAIQIRRLLSVARAPVYSHFSETLGGASSIRAYECPDEFIRRMRDRLDDQVVCMLGNRWLQSWFNLRLSTLAVLVQAATYSVVVLMRMFGVGNVNLLSFSISMTPNLTYGFVQVTSAMVQLEQNVRDGSSLLTFFRLFTFGFSQMNSVERVREYALLESEPPAIIPGRRPPSAWPSEGRIVFDQYTIRYNGKEKPALDDLSFAIRPREKVGIVGRTGAGKCTTTQTHQIVKTLESLRIPFSYFDACPVSHGGAYLRHDSN
jgi:ATP-binding cassette, subfamily C (CFTR/MRP), member 1